MPKRSTDFLKVNRMSSVGMVVLFLRQFLLLGRALGFVLIYAIYKYYNSEAYETYGFKYIALALLLFIILTLVTAVLRFRHFKFYIDTAEGTFVLEKGVFSKEKTIIQLEKIFQINLKQNVWQQVLDVYELEIETAGSSRVEVSIPALSEQVAQDLKRELQVYAEGESASEGADDTDEARAERQQQQRFYVGNKNIFYAALLSHYGTGLRVAVGFMVLIWTQVNEWAGLFSDQSDEERLLYWYDAFDASTLLVFLGIFLLIPFFINTFLFVVRYYNISYTLLNAKELGIDYGLFTLQHKIFQSKKLQQFNISYNWFLKRKGLSIITLLQSENAVGRKQKSTTIFPGISNAGLENLEQLFYGMSVKKGNAIGPYINKLIFGLFFRVVFTVGIGWAAIRLLEMPSAVWGLVIAVLLWNVLIAVMRYKNDKLYLHPDFIIKQSGAFRKTLKIIEPYKIQNIEVHRKVWKPNFGSLQLHTASGTIFASWYDYNTLHRWSEYLSVSIIRSQKQWM